MKAAGGKREKGCDVLRKYKHPSISLGLGTAITAWSRVAQEAVADMTAQS